MATVKNIDFILNKMLIDKMPYYKVLDSDGKMVLDENQDPDMGYDAASRSLRDTLENLKGLVHVALNNKTGKELSGGGAVRGMRFTVKLDEPSFINGTPQSSTDVESIREAIKAEYEAKFEAFKKEVELSKRIEKLEEQLKEKEDSSGFNEMAMQMIAGMFGPQMPGTPLNGQPNINGLDGRTNTERINEAIRTLWRNDKNFVEHIEKLAEIAEKKPMVYAIAIDKLKEY